MIYRKRVAFGVNSSTKKITVFSFEFLFSSIKVFKVCFFIGNNNLSRILSCDRVIDGAFFSHPDFQVPEEKMCQHAR